MKLEIRYDESCQIIEFDETTEDLAWLGLDFEGEDISPEEREKRIQEAFDEQYNKPEYNNWHKHASFLFSVLRVTGFTSHVTRCFFANSF